LCRTVVVGTLNILYPGKPLSSEYMRQLVIVNCVRNEMSTAW
jgi:hypothetical protein